MCPNVTVCIWTARFTKAELDSEDDDGKDEDNDDDDDDVKEG